MKINTTATKIKCDIAGCRLYANYTVASKGFFADKNLNICDTCMQKIYTWYGKRLTPKSPNNVLNKTRYEKSKLTNRREYEK